MGRSTVCSILKDTCEAIWAVLQPKYVKAPASVSEWKAISTDFERIWNFPYCIGKPNYMYSIITGVGIRYYGAQKAL